MSLSEQSAADRVLDSFPGSHVVERPSADKSDLIRPWMRSIPMSEGIGERVHDALDVDSVLADVPDAEGIQEWIERPLTIYGARLVLGQIDDRDTVYVAMECADPATGEQIVITTGADYVMHQLARFYTLDAFPVTVKPYLQMLGIKGQSDPVHLGRVDRPAPNAKGRSRKGAGASAADDENPF